MSLTLIRRLLSSFNIKLFLWFWFITLISIITTRFVSSQLLNDDNLSIIAQHVDKGDLRLLNRAKIKLLKHPFMPLKETLERPEHHRKGFSLWTQHRDDKLIVNKLSKQKGRFNDIIKKHIQTREDNTLQSIIFHHTRVTGPISIHYNNQDVLLFVAKKLPRKSFQHFIKEMPIWLKLAIPLMVSFILCWILARSLSNPILKMKNATLQVAQGNLTTRVTGLDNRRDEIGELAHCFNQMASKLETNISAQQRLLGDVSHELRSPLTRLQMALALAQQEGTDQEKYFERCQHEINQLDEMIAHVLTLSRLENTFQPLNITSLNLSLLVEDIASNEQLLAEDKQVAMSLHADKNILIEGDSHLIHGAITNVLINAIKHSPANSTISISLTQSHDHISLIITDSGQGVPQNALTKIFTAFYRVNSARDRESGGTGLGLAIAKQAINAHQGSIFANNMTPSDTRQSGLAVTIKLPKKQAKQ